MCQFDVTNGMVVLSWWWIIAYQYDADNPVSFPLTVARWEGGMYISEQTYKRLEKVLIKTLRRSWPLVEFLKRSGAFDNDLDDTTDTPHFGPHGWERSSYHACVGPPSLLSSLSWTGPPQFSSIDGCVASTLTRRPCLKHGGCCCAVGWAGRTESYSLLNTLKFKKYALRKHLVHRNPSRKNIGEITHVALSQGLFSRKLKALCRKCNWMSSSGGKWKKNVWWHQRETLTRGESFRGADDPDGFDSAANIVVAALRRRSWSN